MTGVVIPAGKPCPVCGAQMLRENPWWWTRHGATCSDPCADVLAARPDPGGRR